LRRVCGPRRTTALLRRSRPSSAYPAARTQSVSAVRSGLASASLSSPRRC
jgi:hypothetical protein